MDAGRAGCYTLVPRGSVHIGGAASSVSGAAMKGLKVSKSPDPEVLSVARQVATIVRRVTGDPAYRAFLFGSWASGMARERSDIDIGIKGPTGIDPGTMVEIREACDALPTLYTIELVDFARVPEDFRREALSRSLQVEPD